jgi:hypothetical protein
MPSVIGRPTASEFAPYYGRYIGRIGEGTDPVQVLAAQLDTVPQTLAAVPADRERFRYAPDKWSITQVVGHLTDSERIFAYRLLWIARGDTTPLPGFEQTDFVARGGFDARALADVTSDWAAARRSTIALVRGLAPDVWERRGTASGHAVSARALLFIITGHVEHHLAVLREHYGVRG